MRASISASDMISLRFRGTDSGGIARFPLLAESWPTRTHHGALGRSIVPGVHLADSHDDHVVGGLEFCNLDQLASRDPLRLAAALVLGRGNLRAAHPIPR